jgi:hypothetical protein
MTSMCGNSAFFLPCVVRWLSCSFIFWCNLNKVQTQNESSLSLIDVIFGTLDPELFIPDPAFRRLLRIRTPLRIQIRIRQPNFTEKNLKSFLRFSLLCTVDPYPFMITI